MSAGAGRSWLLATLLLAGTACAGWACAGCSDGNQLRDAETPMTSTTLKVAGRDVLVELALDDPARFRGLMYRTELADERGMLFIFPKADFLHFYMKNTLIPLDIVFLEPDGTVINVTHGTPGVEVPTCDSLRPARMVLELNAGWAEKHGLKAGDKVGIPPEVLPLGH
jgi:uncharacterized membrane protein (UPF0127 family)